MLSSEPFSFSPFCRDNAVGPHAIREVITPYSSFPIIKGETFSTHYDNQTNVAIEVYESKGRGADDSLLLGGFYLSGITPAPQGVPEIKVTMSIDANYELSVRADDGVTGRSANTSVSGLNGLSMQEIEDMKNTLQAYEGERIHLLGCYVCVDLFRRFSRG